MTGEDEELSDFNKQNQLYFIAENISIPVGKEFITT